MITNNLEIITKEYLLALIEHDMHRQYFRLPKTEKPIAGNYLI